MKFSQISFLLLLILTQQQDEIEIDLSNSENRKIGFDNFFKDESTNDLKIKERDFTEDLCQKRPNPLDPNFYYVIPTIKAKLYKEFQQVKFTSRCFKEITATFKSFDKNKILLTLETKGKKKFLCTDTFLIHTSNINKIVPILTNGNHKIKIKHLTQNDIDEIKYNSIKILGFCQGIISSIKSLFMSIKLYLGGMGLNPKNPIPFLRPKVPEYLEKANIEMLKLYNNYTCKPRKNNLVKMNKKNIHTGDFVGVHRVDGLGSMIQMGTGSHIGHAAVAAWIDGELYVLESQDSPNWPKKGIQKNKYEDFVKYAMDTERSVVILPMKEELRKKFNEKKAIQWFLKEAEGLDYGYKNFIFSWIDTKDKNLPFITSHELVEIIFSIIEKFNRKLSEKMVGEGLNLRLGTKGLSIPEIIAKAAKKGMSFEELLAIPERDEWVYSNGKNFVCSAFVTYFYKVGGLFNGIDIQAREFTPRDIYMLDFWDKNYKRPKECVDADPDLPYCQIMGKFKVELPGYSSVHPYSKMNEKCPTQGPKFERPNKC